MNQSTSLAYGKRPLSRTSKASITNCKMDKVKKYQEIIIDFLKEQAKPTLGMDTNIKREVIIDRESNNIQLLC